MHLWFEDFLKQKMLVSGLSMGYNFDEFLFLNPINGGGEFYLLKQESANPYYVIAGAFPKKIAILAASKL